MIKRIFLTLSLLGVAYAQELPEFLATLDTHPAITASRSLVNASQTQLDAVYFPVSGELSGGYNRQFIDFSDANYQTGPTDPFFGQDLTQRDQDRIANAAQFSASMSFRPFVFGDIADLARQRELDLMRNQLSFTETLATLEAQAVESSAQVTLAEMSVLLSQEAVALSESVLEITRTRFDKGAATNSDIRSAEQSLFEARNQLRSAELNVRLAQQGLINLVGAANLNRLPQLLPVAGTLPDITRAQFDLELAKVGQGNSQRGLYPVGQISYTAPIVHEETRVDRAGDPVLDASGNEILDLAVNSEVAFSVESRTLQPTVTYSYQNPKQTVAGIPAQPQFNLGLSDLEGSLSIGVSLSISPDTIASFNAANAQLEASQARLQSVIDNASLTELSLENALESASLSLELSKQSLGNAEFDLANTQERVDLGLAIELDLKQSSLAVTQAKLSVLSAEFSYLQAVLNTYRTYAMPISQTLLEVQE